MELTHGSLFAGIGGFDLGFEREGFQTIWQVEIDDYATKVLEKHWPNVQRFRDIKTVGRHNLAIPTVVSGGFPCQDISDAGKRQGITGSRSSLWTEFRRLIGELRPCYVVVENVAALYGRGLGTVLGDLASCGYDAEWDCLPAAAFGAPHLRERIFIVAYPHRRGLPESGVCQEQPRGTQAVSTGQAMAHTRLLRPKEHEVQADRPEQCGQDAAHAQSLHAQGFIYRPRERQPGRSSWWTTEPALGRVAHGVPDRVDRLKCLGNAVVPQVAEFVAWQIRKSIEREAP